MPLIVFRVRRAKPAATLIAEDFGGFVAWLVEVRDSLTRRLGFLVWTLAGWLGFHDDTRAAILLRTGKSRKKLRRRSAACAIFAHGLIDQRV